MDEQPNGVRARVDMLERNQREIYDRLRVVDRLDERVAAMAASTTAGIEAARHDVRRLSRKFEEQERLRRAENQREKQERREEENEKRRLSKMDLAIIVPAVIAVIALLVTSIVNLIGSGIL